MKRNGRWKLMADTVNTPRLLKAAHGGRATTSKDSSPAQLWTHSPGHEPTVANGGLVAVRGAGHVLAWTPHEVARGSLLSRLGFNRRALSRAAAVQRTPGN